MTQLTDKDFYTLWGEALAAADRDMFVAEWSTSIIWGDPEYLTDEDLIVQAEYLGKLWAAAHMSLREMWKASGLSQAAFALKFCVPKRTVEDWCSGLHAPADYVRLMMIKMLGLLP